MLRTLGTTPTLTRPLVKTVTNESGMLTMDFVFALVLILGLSSLLFVTSFTLSVASIVQYITFAAARNYTVAHIDQDTQEKLAVEKYKELTANKVFKPLFSNGWYQIDAEPKVGDHAEFISGYQSATKGVNQFYGVGTQFVAQVLDFRIPFFGSTTEEGDGAKGFKTYLGSYLGREVTTEECLKFVAARWTAIRNLSVQGGSSYSTGTQDKGYYPMTDDGC